jgi:hypothetical protein
MNSLILHPKCLPECAFVFGKKTRLIVQACEIEGRWQQDVFWLQRVRFNRRPEVGSEHHGLPFPSLADFDVAIADHHLESC